MDNICIKYSSTIFVWLLHEIYFQQDIWKNTVEKSQTNATNATMHLLVWIIWGHIWRHTVEKNQTSATNVTMHLLMQAIWGHIWKRTVGKSHTNATNVTLHPVMQVLWGHTLKCTVEKVKQMQAVWLCISSCRPYEDTFDKAHWRKVGQMQPMWLCHLG